MIASAPALARDPARGDALLIGDAEGYLSSFDAATGALRWRRKLVQRIESPTLLPTSALIGAPPLVGADGTIFLGGRDGILSALDRDGTVRWRYASGSDIAATPAQAPDGTLYVGLLGKRLAAVGPDGRLHWSVHMGGAVRSAPFVAPDGTLYVSTLGGQLYALAPAQS